MPSAKHKVFISYHHANDQAYKDVLLKTNQHDDIFMDVSVDTGDIDESLSDEAIRQKIRDEYLKDSSVTIVLVGTETKNRKHVDWEIYSSMFDGQVNKKSGVLAVNLPDTGCNLHTAAHGDEEKDNVYPSVSSWVTVETRAEYEERYPYIPSRIIDNLLKKGVKISVTDWNTVMGDTEKLKLLIDLTFRDRSNCDYDLNAPLRRANS